MLSIHFHAWMHLSFIHKYTVRIVVLGAGSFFGGYPNLGWAYETGDR